MKEVKDFINERGVFNKQAYLAYQIDLMHIALDAAQRESENIGENHTLYDLKTSIQRVSQFLNQAENTEEDDEDKLDELMESYSKSAAAWKQFYLSKAPDAQQKLSEVSLRLPGDDTMASLESLLHISYNAKDIQSQIDSAEKKKAEEYGFEILTADEVATERYVKDNAFNDAMEPIGKAGLFPKGEPQPDEIHQTADGSCYMLSVLRSMAARKPEMIKNLITENKDGKTVTVHFYENINGVKKPLDVTIDKTLPKGMDPNSAPWVRIIEKAYAASELKKDIAFQYPLKAKNSKLNITGINFYDSGDFFDNLVPELESLPIGKIFDQQENFAASLNKFREMILQASENNAIMAVGTRTHMVTVDRAYKVDDEVILDIYNQFAPQGEEHFTMPASFLFREQDPEDESQFTQLFLFDAQATGKMQKTSIALCAIAKRQMELDEPLTSEKYQNRIIEKMTEELRDRLKLLPKYEKTFEASDVISEMKKSLAFQNRINASFDAAKKDGMTRVRDIANIDIYQQNFFANAIEEYCLQAIEKPGKSQVVEGLSKILSSMGTPVERLSQKVEQEKVSHPENFIPVAEETQAAAQNAYQPTPGEKIAMEQISKQLTAMKKAKKAFGADTAEFTGMVNSIRDLKAAYDAGAPSDVISFLQMRTYCKTLHYCNHRNPFSPAGRARKNAATAVLAQLRTINPEIDEISAFPPDAKLTHIEVASTLVEMVERTNPDAFRKQNDSPDVARLNFMLRLSDKKSVENIAGEVEAENAQTFFDSVIPAENRAALTRKAVEKIKLKDLESQITTSSQKKQDHTIDVKPSTITKQDRPLENEKGRSING